MQTTIETLELAGVIQLKPIDGELCLVIPIAPLPLPEPVREQDTRLGGVQQRAFAAVVELARTAGDLHAPIKVQAVYDACVPRLAPPAQGKRDRRIEVTRRALRALGEKGYIEVADDVVAVAAGIEI